MKKYCLSLVSILILINLTFAQDIPGFKVIATYDSTSIGYLEVPDEYGNLGTSGWIWHLIDDVSANGAATPSLEEGNIGYPTGDDILIATGIIGNDELVADTIRTMVKFMRENRFDLVTNPYLRVFASSTLEDSIPYMQLPALPASAFANENQLIEIPLQAFGTGGIMTSWLNEDGIPDEISEDIFDIPSSSESLSLSDDTEASFIGVPITGLKSVTLTRHDLQPERWTMSDVALPGIITLSQDCRFNSTEATQQSLKIPVDADEVEQFYSGNYSVEDMRIYREVVENWVELPSTMVNDNGWKAVIQVSNELLYGRFVIAPQDLFNDASESNPELITEYKLYPAYPNPFNPSTNLIIDIPEKTLATLQVYDILGREVIRIFKGELLQGQHKFIFNAEQYASGTYFLKLDSDKYSSVQRLVLLK